MELEFRIRKERQEYPDIRLDAAFKAYIECYNFQTLVVRRRMPSRSTVGNTVSRDLYS
jgi:hypothetical protein